MPRGVYKLCQRGADGGWRDSGLGVQLQANLTSLRVNGLAMAAAALPAEAGSRVKASIGSAMYF